MKIKIQNVLTDHPSASLSVHKDVKITIKVSNQCFKAVKCEYSVFKVVRRQPFLMLTPGPLQRRPIFVLAPGPLFDRPSHVYEKAVSFSVCQNYFYTQEQSTLQTINKSMEQKVN